MSSDAEQVVKSPKATKKTVKKHPAMKNISKSGQMICNALANLNEKHGSSLAKIKNYITAHHDIDFAKRRHLFNSFLLDAMKDGTIINTSGKQGLTGYFKIVDPKVKKSYTGSFVFKKPSDSRPKPAKKTAAPKKSKDNEDTDKAKPKPKTKAGGTKETKTDKKKADGTKETKTDKKKTDGTKPTKKSDKKVDADKKKTKKSVKAVDADKKKAKKIDKAVDGEKKMTKKSVKVQRMPKKAAN